MNARVAVASACAGILMASAASVARAQGAPHLDGAGLMSSGNGAHCRGALNLAAQGAWHGTSVALLPAPVSSETSYGIATPVVALSAHGAISRHWRVDAAGAIGRAESDCMQLSEWPRQWVQFSRSVGRGGVQFGAGARSLSALDPTRDRQGFTFGVWQAFRRAAVNFEVRAHDANANILRVRDTTIWGPFNNTTNSDTALWENKHVKDTVRSVSGRHAVDLRTRLRFAVGRLTFDVTGGGTVGRGFIEGVQPPSSGSTADSTLASFRAPNVNALRVAFWGRTDMRVPVGSHVTLVAGVAALPAQPILGAPLRGVFSLGFGLTHRARNADAIPDTPVDGASDGRAAQAFETVRDDDSRVHFRVRAPWATAIQLSGEPTQWRAVPMERVNGEWWDVVLAASPGTYRINVSIDGKAWQPPPGVAAVRDEFGGQVGLVTVR